MRANCLHFRTSNTESSSNSHTRCRMSDVCWMCYCRPIEWFRYNRRKRDKLKNFSQSYTKLFGNRHNKNGNDWCARWMVHIELWWADALAGWQLNKRKLYSMRTSHQCSENIMRVTYTDIAWHYKWKGTFFALRYIKYTKSLWVCAWACRGRGGRRWW